ncbi:MULTISPECIES: hypothetical protein [Trueperella]|uniref:DUF2746 domain-containing protein n=1 Tax=Trueperella abortisuis TaxID=445930 RepID=A0ABT9PJT7_9ACTO|nr:MULTISPECIES: hypothetical protein [Trueperella]MCI7306144.1 hypothetical protein [Trueperella sp.]MDP9832987.1 hypothetical protein [Trueperella abortisuis]
MDGNQAETIGQIVAGIGLGLLLLAQFFWAQAKEKFLAWRKRRVSIAKSVQRIEESTVNAHSTKLRDDVDDLANRLGIVERTVAANSEGLGRIEKTLDQLVAITQDTSDRLANEERNRYALGEQARLDYARFDRELQHLKSRVGRCPASSDDKD